MAINIPSLPANMPFPEPLVELPNLTIRPLHPSDAESMSKHGNNPKIAAIMSDRFPHPYTYLDAVHWIGMVLSARPICTYALSLTPTSPCIGSITATWDSAVPNIDHNTELGYWLGEEYWGQGLVTAAVRSFVDWIFKDVSEGGCPRRTERIYIRCADTNPASAAVARKAGFTLEGCLRKMFQKKGQYSNMLVFSLLREEWAERRQEK
jgi:[ribosomal protein S5]-alanine N-acetyltransferase